MAQEERSVKEFLAKYEKLTKECGVDFVSLPQFVPDGSGGWKLVIHTQPIAVEDKNGEGFIVK